MHTFKYSVGQFLLLGIVAVGGSPVSAQLVPDNTLGGESSRVTPNVLINGGVADRIDGGAIRDINLFHSFREFNITDGQRVYFANPSGVQNILTRVTGGNGSNIFGTLGVDGNANLFLVNPNGMLFGENARLDLRGSFVGTTANGLQFGNQGFFNATNPQEVPLLRVNPSALFYNQINPDAAIVNNSVAPAGQNPIGGDVRGLRVPDGKSLLLVGGNVNIDGGQLNAFGGQIELGGLAEAGEINLIVDGDNLQLGFPENPTRADVSLINQANAYVTGIGGGDLLINARNIDILERSILSAGIFPRTGTFETVAGDIRLNATGDIRLADGSAIGNLVRQNSQGQGGNITIGAASFQMRDGAQLIASTFGQGDAGNVKINAIDTVFLIGNATILSTVEAGGVGQGGNIDINAASLSLQDGSQLLTITRGEFGDQPPGKGDAGNVNVRVSGEVNIAGSKNGFSSAIGSNLEVGTEGNGGNITIDAGSFQMRGSAVLSASNSGQGNAGNVNVKVSGEVDIASVNNELPSVILSLVGTEGNGGNITIDAGSFQLRDRAQLLASTFGQGNAGNVKITATDTVSLVGNPASILSTVEPGGVGRGGNIDIDAASLSLQDGAQLLTITLGVGDAGNVNVKVSGEVDIAGVKNGFSSGIGSNNVDTGTEGNGGDITINANSFKVRDGALLDSRTQNNNRGGDITVNANVVKALNGGQLTAITSGNGSAGKITVNAKDRVTISANDPNYNDRLANFPDLIRNIGPNSGFFVNSTGAGITGNIEVNSPRIILDNQGILKAESASGRGGNINLNTVLLLLRRGSQISTNAGTTQQGGDGGNINLDSTFIVAIPKENSDITANAFTGKGGNIDIKTQGIFGIEPRSQASDLTNDITASSELGVQGEVAITEPDVDPAQGTIELPTGLEDKSDQIGAACPRNFAEAEKIGSFTVTGRGNLPPSLLEPLAGGNDIANLVNLAGDMQISAPVQQPRNREVNKPNQPIIEARGWVKHADGKVELVAKNPQSISGGIENRVICPRN